jgi:hypothetical protein
MSVEGATRDELRHAALPAVGRLDVVEHRAAATPVVDAGALVGSMGLGPDVEPDDETRFCERVPQWIPLLVVPRWPLEGRTCREEAKVESELGGAPHLGHGVADLEKGDRGGAHIPRRVLLERQGPVVERLHTLTHDDRGTDVEGPDAQ